MHSRAASSPTLNGTTPSSLVPSNVVNGTLVRVIGCFGNGRRTAERAWRSGIRVGGERSGLRVVLLLLARRKEGTTTSDRRGASQSAATLCSAILSTHNPPRASRGGELSPLETVRKAVFAQLASVLTHAIGHAPCRTRTDPLLALGRCCSLKQKPGAVRLTGVATNVDATQLIAPASDNQQELLPTRGRHWTF